MFTRIRPTDDLVSHYLALQAGKPFSYAPVGCTRDARQRRGWSIDRHRVPLGSGEATFEAAREAIRRWEMFPKQMATLYWPDRPQQPGETVAVLFRAEPLFCWMLMPARVVYAVDESIDRSQGTLHRFGFAYGTLPDHMEAGEERFLVEWDEADNSVWYDLLAISRPRHFLARLAYPYTRSQQARFRRLSGEAMQAACAFEGAASLEQATP